MNKTLHSSLCAVIGGLIIIVSLLMSPATLRATSATISTPPPIITRDSMIETVAGGGTQPLITTPITATLVQFGLLADVTVDDTGTLYLLAPGCIYTVSPVGQLTIFGGCIRNGTRAEGALISNAEIGSNGAGIIAAPNGALYFADSARVRRVDSDRSVYTVAGSTTSGFSGDGGIAISATLRTVNGLALGADGSLYIADRDNNRIRRVGPDGVITTISGNGTVIANPTCSIFNPGCGDGGPATSAVVWVPESVAIAARGPFSTTLYHGNNSPSRVRAVLPSGIITSVASTNFESLGSIGAGSWQGQGLAVGPDDHLYFSYSYGPGGYLGRLDLNTGQVVSLTQMTASAFTPQGDGGPLKDAVVAFPSRMTFGPDGALYFIDGNHSRVRRITPVRNTLLQPGNAVTLTSPNGQVTLNVPIGAVSQPATMTLSQPYQLGGDTSDFLRLPQQFRLTLNGSMMTLLDNAALVTMSYSDVDLQRAGVQSESQLNVYVWQNDHWVPLLPCAGCAHNTANNTLTFKLNRAGDYALLASKEVPRQNVFAPVVVR